MKNRKPRKWFIYARLLIVFVVVFTFGNTAKAVYYSELVSNNNDDQKKVSQAVILDNKEEIYIEENPVLTKYLSVPEKGFVVTNTNTPYEIPESDYKEFIAIVASESHTNKDDILAVISVILNRADASGITPLEVLKKPGQFEGYLAGHYLKYFNEDGSLGSTTDLVQEVAKDALSGVRNNNYYSFRSWWMSSYSDNYIAERGNRFN